jgi:hydrogenase nickel incorporation protein HypA/HybF
MEEMHELSVTEGLIQVVSDEVKKKNLSKVTGITLVIGDLTSIIDDSVQFYFDILSKGTALQGAVLFFKRIMPEYECRECKHVFAGRYVGSMCPKCGGKTVIASKGQEFFIESIEVEDSED